MVVVERHVAKQSPVHIEGAIEKVGLEHATDPLSLKRLIIPLF